MNDKFMIRLETCRKPLLSFIRHSIWNKELLDDTFQATVLEGWKKFGSFSGDERGFRLWIFQIADFVTKSQNRTYAKYENRKEGAVQEAENSEHSSDTYLAGPSGQAFIQLEQNHYGEFLNQSKTILNTMEDQVKESVMALTENERNVFLLRSVGDFTYDEISKMLSIPIGSVMGFLARARTKLRENLLDYARKQHNL